MSDISRITVCFHEDAIEFTRYPFPPSPLYPSGNIAYSEIREFDARMAPPEVRASTGEILFIPALMKEELRRAAACRGIPCVKRIDVWDLLLEPFLDTEFDEEHQRRSLRTLEECGISRDESGEIRAFVGPAVMAYNLGSGLWDWCHLGLSDVLDAFLGHLSGRLHRLPPKDYEGFYWRAMELAGRGKITG